MYQSLPFVKEIFLCNSISFNALKRDSDIDLFNLDVETLDTYARLRMIVDLLSGMTDKYAVSLYQQLSGQKLK